VKQMDLETLLPQVWQNSVNMFWNGVWVSAPCG
jgi:hypothetical protein